MGATSLGLFVSRSYGILYVTCPQSTLILTRTVDLVVVRALRIIGQSATTLRSALIRMAFSDSTPSAKAVLRALLALSSLHRHGSQKQAESYKYAALGAMREAARVQLQGKALLQHVAASMLLCTFEVMNTVGRLVKCWLTWDSRRRCGASHISGFGI